MQVTDTEGSNRITFGAGVDSAEVTVSMSGGIVFVDYSAIDYAFMDVATFERLEGLSFSDGSTIDAGAVRKEFTPGGVANGTLPLAVGVAANEITLYRRGEDLLLTYSGPVSNFADTSTLNARNVLFEQGAGTGFGLAASTQVLVLTGWYRANPSTYVREFLGADTSIVNFTVAAAAASHLASGDAAANYLVGSGAVDILVGGAGADALDGGDGADDLLGGAGDDTLLGGAGSDVYRINTGDGSDLILDEAGTDDVVRFGPGITPAMLTVAESAAGLAVQVGAVASGDALLILDWSQGSARSIDRFVFDDGTSLSRAQIDTMNTGNHSPRVAATIAEQLARIGQAFTYTVPAGTFIDQDVGDTLTYAATRTDGTALPAWLSFNPVTRTFTGTPTTSDAGAIPVRVQVTDSGGLRNSLEFDIRATSAIVLTGTASANTLTASTAADYEIYGLGGNDTLTGNAGNDRLEGGTGNDVLNGAAGSDTYVYARGDGSDTINQNDASAGKVDTLLLRAGVFSGDVVLASETDGDLVVFVRNADGSLPSTPSVTVTAGLVGETNVRKIDRILFEEDGTVLTLAEIEQRAMTPTENADYLRGSSATADALNGLGGSDVLLGLGGGDTLAGGSGNDTLDGGDGDDVLSGGEGSDTLAGGAGSDVYLMNRGDGFDSISATPDANPASIDAVQFGPGVLPGDVQVQRFGTTLYLQITDPSTGNTLNSISVTSGFDDVLGSQVLDEVRFTAAPAVVWSRADLQAMTLVGTANADSLVGFATADVLQGNGGNDYLQGAGGNDQLIGGAGNDQLNGDAGDDSYYFGRGQGYDEINDSSGVNRIVLDAGVATSAVTLYRTSSLGLLTSSQESTSFDDLVLILDAGRDQIRVEGFYNGQATRPVSEIVFADGAVWNATDIDSRVVNFGGTANTQTGATTRKGPVNDSFTVDHPGDVLVDGASTDVDTATATVSFILPANVENLTVSGPFHLNATGNELYNVITGNALDNVIDGRGGADTMYGAAGNDIFLFFNDGNSDQLYGGAGDDVYYIGTEAANPYVSPNDDVYEDANAGYDVVYAQSFEYTLPANVEAVIFQDVPGSYSSSFLTQLDIIGNALDNLIDARQADRQFNVPFVIDGGAGADTIYVVNGAVNRVLVDHAGDVVNGADANDTIVARVTYTLSGTAINLELTGTAGISGTGNAVGNKLNGATSSGANVLAGLAGDDVYTIGVGDSVVELAGAGNDTVTVAFAAPDGNVQSLAAYQNVENLAVTDAAGAAALVGTAQDNALTGNASANVLDGLAGNDVLVGQAGNDRYVGVGLASGHDVINDTGGLDVVELEPGSVTDPGQLAISRSGGDLLIGVGPQSSVRIQSWFTAAAGANVVESLVLQRDGLSYAYTSAQLEARANGLNGAPVVNAATQDQAVGLNVPFTLQIASNLFADLESQDTLVLSATLADGAALPSWMVFDPVARTFSGTPGAGNAGVFTIKVTAVDGGGLAASDEFLMDIGSVQRFGTSGDDTLTGTAGTDWISGLAGHDILDGLGGDDRLFGDEGDDSVTGGAGIDVLSGGSGADVLAGGSDADELRGGGGSDLYVIDAASGSDVVIETGGFDRIEFSSSSGIVIGGLAASRAGDDLLLTFNGGAVSVAGHYANASQRVEEFGTYVAGLPYVYSAAQIEGLVSGLNTAPYAGTPIGNRAARANTTWSFQVPAHTFTDTASQGSLVYSARQVGGAALPTWLTFSSTTRTLSGKPPNGTNLDYSVEIVATDPQGLATTAAFTLHVRGSLSTWTGTASADTVAGTTGLDYQLGLAGNDTLNGNSGNDIQDGGEGNDTLNGQAGADIAYGGAGNDLIDGGDGNDTLNGDAGRDTLLGGLGVDVLRGGTGADTLAGGADADTLVGGDGADVYRFGTGDGAETIDNSSTDEEFDVLDITNLTRAQLTFARSGNDLTITRTSTSDSVRVTNWFTALGNRIDELRTSDGLRTTADQVDALIAGGGGVFGSTIVAEQAATAARAVEQKRIWVSADSSEATSADTTIHLLVDAMAAFPSLGAVTFADPWERHSIAELGSPLRGLSVGTVARR